MSAVAASAPGRTATWGPWFGLVCRLALGGTLLVAGLLKISDLTQAARAVNAYRLFDPSVANAMGYALPPLEICIGLLLIVGLFTRAAAAAAGLLMLAFIIGVVSVWVRGYNIDCGCFGGGGDVSGAGRAWRYASEVLRDLLLLGLASWLVVLPLTRFSLDRVLRPQLYRSPDLDPIDLPDAEESGS